MSVTGTLVGLAVGLSVVVLAWQAWASLRWSLQSLRARAMWEQNARPMAALLQELADQAGSASLKTPSGPGAQLSAYFAPASGTDGASSQGDTFTLSQERSLFPDDCQGNTLTGPPLLSNQFKLSTKLELTCKDTQRAGSLFQALAERAEDFQVLYVQRSGTLSQPQWQWRSASQITDWSRVQGAEICLRLASPLRIFQGSNTMAGCQGETVARDGRYRQLWRWVMRFEHAAP
jgi:hypothetical protein